MREVDLAFHEAKYHRLASELEWAAEASRLPERAAEMAVLDDLLVRLRLGGYGR